MAGSLVGRVNSANSDEPMLRGLSEASVEGTDFMPIPRSNASITNSVEPRGAGGRIVCCFGDRLAPFWVFLLRVSYGAAQRMVFAEGPYFTFVRTAAGLQEGDQVKLMGVRCGSDHQGRSDAGRPNGLQCIRRISDQGALLWLSLDGLGAKRGDRRFSLGTCYLELLEVSTASLLT